MCGKCFENLKRLEEKRKKWIKKKGKNNVK